MGPGKSVLLGFVLFEQADRKLDRQLGSYKTHLLIDNAEFYFPSEYINYATNAKAPYKGMAIINLDFVWPDFMPTRLATSDELINAKKISNYNIGSLWITKAFPEKVKQALSTNPYPQEIRSSEPIGKLYGLEKYQHYKRTYKSEDVISDGNSYILRDSKGAIVDAIYCFGTIAPDTYPSQCEYHFVDKGLLYNVRFAEMPHLKNWLEWKEKSISYIDRYRKLP